MVKFEPGKKQKIDQAFDDISLIFFKDIPQLPPVAEKPLHHKNSSGAIDEQDYLAYVMFNKVLKLITK